MRDITQQLNLDILMIDTHPGLNEETLLSMALSHVLLVVMRPDQQDYEGTGVTIKVARRLEVGRLLILVNKLPAAFDPHQVQKQVEEAYNSPVAAILPHSDELMTLASAGIFAIRYPNHPLSDQYRAVADQLIN
jgi:MinD-like ATPase involved in chromosome partitioning or flagellar assembly